MAQQPKSSNTPSEPKKTYPPGRAWTLTSPLGLHQESTMDTLLYNYQRTFISALGSDAWATTGQFTGPAINMFYFDRPQTSAFLPDDAISYWLPSFSKQHFYNVYIPYTQLIYSWGFGNEIRTDHLKATFAGNINRKAGLGAWIDYPYTRGAYSNQAAKGLGFGFNGYYTGDRYEMQAFFNHYNHVNKENGGITDDLYIKDPAQLQGGVSSIESTSIPVNLNKASNRLIGSQFYMNHAYKLGYWKDITQEEDTIERREFVPVSRFIYSFDYKDSKRIFHNLNAIEGADFWRHFYFNETGTDDRSGYRSISNTIGVELMEGFRKWVKFGLSAYVNYSIDRYRYRVHTPQGVNTIPPVIDPGDGDVTTEPATTIEPLPTTPVFNKTEHRLWVGGRLEKTRGAILRYHADVKVGLSGDVAGDINLSGALETRFRLGKDTVSIGANAAFINEEPNFMYRHYAGNHFVWNNDFGKTRTIKAGAHLYIPWSKTLLSVNIANVQNLVFFGPSSTPVQHSGNIQILSAAIDQKLKFGIWNWNNTVTWQTSSDKTVIPLPALTVYSNMFLGFHAFRALDVQIGVDCNWYSSYPGLAYQPALMAFHTQGNNAVKVGGFINSDVYLTCKLYKVRLFLMVSHLNQGWWSKDYFSLPHYPIDPRQFRLGLSIDFAN